MPPKTKYSAEDIIQIAFDLVRTQGWKALSARAIAAKLKSSTMPVFNHFKNMQSLEEEVVKKALDLLLEYQLASNSGDKILDFGIGYIRFAKEEKHLFRGMTDEKNAKVILEHGKKHFFMVLNTHLKDAYLADLSLKERRKRLFVQWVFIHGLASLNNNVSIMDLLQLDAKTILKEVRAVAANLTPSAKDI